MTRFGRLTSALLFALAASCGMSEDDGESSEKSSLTGAAPTTEAACPPSACGPAPGAPVEICADGSTAGPRCQPMRGACGWVITKCPVTGPCEGLDKETCARNAACDWISGGAPTGVGGPAGGCVPRSQDV
jgi:hypothetical protein